MIKNHTATIKIVIADDHLFFRTGFKRVLLSQDETHQLELVAEAANGIELIDCVNFHMPDIVFTDVKMPKMSGIDATKIIKKSFPAMHIIALSALEDTSTIMSMFRAGASGYVIKNTDFKEIIDAIHTVRKGKHYYCPAVLNKMSGEYLADKVESAANSPIQFSTQEKNVLRLICRQLTTKEIAENLKLSIRTVEDYRRRLQEKVGAKNIVGVVMYGLTNEIIKLDEL